MKRLLFLLLVVAAGVGAYGWYRGELPRWGRAAKSLVDRVRSGTPIALAPEEAGAKPPAGASARIPDDALAALRSDDTSRRNAAWEQLSRLYTTDPAARDALAPHLERFTSAYVLSDWRDESVAEIVNVRPGYSLARIADRRGTTVDAIKRINNLNRDTIHPGETLKVLNRPIEIFVSKREFRLWVTYGGRFLKEMRCGIGKGNRTPAGTFVIAEKQRNPDWSRPGQPVIPAGDPANELGCCWLGFAETQYKGLGIHEARDGRGIGQESSQGCIRVARADIDFLHDFVPYRTVVTIME